MVIRRFHDFEDRIIRLTGERWAHIQEHPEMATMEGAIAQTLATPEVVIQSLADPKAHLYHRFYVGTKVGDKFLCVVVKFQDDDAFVLTAYLTNKIGRGTVIWRAK
jgi:hypothetical protein